MATVAERVRGWARTIIGEPPKTVEERPLTLRNQAPAAVAGGREGPPTPSVHVRIEPAVWGEMAHPGQGHSSGIHHASGIGHRSEIHERRLEGPLESLDLPEREEDR